MRLYRVIIYMGLSEKLETLLKRGKQVSSVGNDDLQVGIYSKLREIPYTPPHERNVRFSELMEQYMEDRFVFRTQPTAKGTGMVGTFGDEKYVDYNPQPLKEGDFMRTTKMAEEALNEMPEMFKVIVEFDDDPEIQSVEL